LRGFKDKEKISPPSHFLFPLMKALGYTLSKFSPVISIHTICGGDKPIKKEEEE
jgi:hypothetical protein